MQPADGLPGLAGLDTVRDQLEAWLAVVRAERARSQVGMQVHRPAWKNLIFAGGSGAGKSRAAAAVAAAYREARILPGGTVYEVGSASLVGSTARETGELVHLAADRAMGRVLMIAGADAWNSLPDGGLSVLRTLYAELSLVRHDLAVILAGDGKRLGEVLRAHPPLTARFSVVIEFPGYSPGQLADVFGALAAEAGFALGPGTADKAARVLAEAVRQGNGGGRLAVELLRQSAAAQALRITGAEVPPEVLEAGDVPDVLTPRQLADEAERPGLYL